MGIFQSFISFFLSLICLIAGHDVAFSPIIEPTCKEVGYLDASHCERCGKILDFEEVLPTEHNYVNNKCVYCGAAKEFDPYELLLDYIYEYGEVDGVCVNLDYYTDSGARYSLTHWSDTDSLFLNYFKKNREDGFIVYASTIINPSDNTMEFEFRYGTDGETRVKGHAKKSTFTTKTPITVDYYNGPDEYYFEDVEYLRLAVTDLLGFLEWYLDSYNVGLTLADLGYSSFVY